MSVIPKDPVDWLTLFRQQVEVIFNYLSSAERLGGKDEHEYLPLVDIFDTADNYVVEFELPGFDRKDLRLSVCCNTLLLEGVKRREGRKGCRFIRVERHFGHFSRMIEIPPSVDIQGVKARYDKGTLSVTFPRLHGNQEVIRDVPIE
ncbi:Hsp20/alpha crystallin family protein [Geobacter pelophilus]|jgi:HSP20 family protein|uniref:Hsp20/alpha crystallin family protein n=1 Tax=Geoanaerobacter pelophilus TaxID=60036 RepID=A0AAW4KZE8_9BACT|nr:Hsp20/alpha crystallin family protein [Geoanaerobacter pelophilus]MBT0664021.1 Hsp20/alpha crystallin family protein [Geoanaerobacter pelophilus]